MDQGDRGVYCVAYGEQALMCAREMIRTLHKNAGLPACLVSNHKLPEADVFKYRADGGRGGRWAKTGVWRLAPEEWTYILYMDVDMMVRGSLEPFFRPLYDGWDLVMTESPPYCPTVKQSRRKRYREEDDYTAALIGGDHWLQLAGGIWSFRRNEKTRGYFKSLHEEWNRFGDRDQMAMNRAWFRHTPRTWLLPWEFNWFVHHERPSDRAVVLHFATAARSWICKHPGRRLWREWAGRL